jgi:hypothetical protein
MRTVAVAALALVILSSVTSLVRAETSNNCKQCSDQQRACMRNYAGPTCKTEYQICMKSCGKK